MPQALWSAALVAYTRCFTTGKRFGLATKDVRTLPLHGEVMKFHKWMLGERDQVTSHPADPFAAAKVGAALSRPRRAAAGGGYRDPGRQPYPGRSTGRPPARRAGVGTGQADRGAGHRQQDMVLADAQQISVDSPAKLDPLQVGPHLDDPDAP